jgi:hypothetical protein
MELPYERAALNGLEMPEGLDLVDHFMYLCLRELYSSHKKGVISREVGQIEKGKLMYSYDIAKKRFRFEARRAEDFANRTMRIESAANAYAKDRTLESADKLYKALYGMLPTKEEES